MADVTVFIPWIFPKIVIALEKYLENGHVELEFNRTRLHKSRSSRSELEFDLSNFV